MCGPVGVSKFVQHGMQGKRMLWQQKAFAEPAPSLHGTSMTLYSVWTLFEQCSASTYVSAVPVQDQGLRSAGTSA